MAVKETNKTVGDAASLGSGEDYLHDYEMVTVYRPGATDVDNEQIVKGLEQLITGLGGTIKLMEPWGKKKLAYPIMHYKEGYYILARFKLVPGKTGELDNKLKINEQVLRHMLILEES